MASYRMSMKVHGRSGGRSAVNAAAYRHAEKLHSPDLGKTVSYTNKQGVAHSRILAPEKAPEWAYDRQKLWASVEDFENRKDAQLFRECQVNLPVELSKDKQIELVESWCQKEFVDKGMIADIAIHHDNPKNPHAHIMLTLRDIDKGGWGKKNRDWNSRELLHQQRENWANEQNMFLAREGLDARVSHLSNAERGLSVVPQAKLGAAGPDVTRARQEAHDAIAQDNGEHLKENPDEFLKLLPAEGRAVWTQRDMDRVAHRYTLDDEQFQQLRASVAQSPHLIHLEGGKFTSARVLETEQKLLESAQVLHGRSSHFVHAKNLDPRLNSDQQAAVKSLCEGGDLVIVEGAPGVGKSFMLKDAVNAWRSDGYRVIAGGLQSFQAANFARDAGIKESGSLARWETLWAHEKQQLGSKTVMVIDEFGMVGTEQAQRILAKAEAAGAKICLIGDRHQLPAIQHGAPLRLLADELGAQQIKDIVRQDSEWHREAIKDIRAGREDKGFEAFKAHGCIVEKDKDDAFKEMVQQWKEARDEGKSAALLAYQRKDVFELNQLAREEVRDGLSGPAISVKTKDGVIELQRGDEIMLRQNDSELGVKNGEIGKVLAVENDRIEVRMHHGKDVSIDIQAYRDENGKTPLQLSHAFTGHKSQGATYDVAFVSAHGSLANREWLHVAVSRPRNDVKVFTEDQRALERAFSKSAQKEMAADFRQVERPQEPIDINDERGRARLREHYRGFSDKQLEGIAEFARAEAGNRYAPIVADVVREMREEIAQKKELGHDRQQEIVRDEGGRARESGHRGRTSEVPRADALDVRSGHREDLQRDRGVDEHRFRDGAKRDGGHGLHDESRQRGSGPNEKEHGRAGGERQPTDRRDAMDARHEQNQQHHRPLEQAALGAGHHADDSDRGSRGADRHLDQPEVGRSRGGPSEHELRQRDHERDGVPQGQTGQAFGEIREHSERDKGRGLDVHPRAATKEGQEVTQHGESISRSTGERQESASIGMEARPYEPGGGFRGQLSGLTDSLREHSERSREREDSVAQAYADNRDGSDECSKTLEGLEQGRQGIGRGVDGIQRQIEELDRQQERGHGLSL
jgi:Ti-type conjugative transfer relaxase TraA